MRILLRKQPDEINITAKKDRAKNLEKSMRVFKL